MNHPVFVKPSHRYPLVFVRLLLILLTLLLLSSPAAAEKPLLINSGSSAPMILDDQNGFYPKIVQTLFKRLNKPVKTVHLPSSSSIKNVIQGIDDGLIGRIKGLEEKQANLVLVKEKVMDLSFTAYSNDKSINLSSWNDLGPYNVAYIRGWKIFDKKVKSYKSLVKVKNPQQLFKLLKRQRVDIILYQNIPGKYLMNKMAYFPHEQPHYLATREMFIYMNKRHVNLVPKMEAELRKMKADGTYQQIYDEYITRPISPAN